MSKEPTPRMDPAWIRGMTQRRMSRRDLFRYAGAGAGALGLSSILAACGVSGEAQTTGPTAGAEGSPEWWADMKTQGPGDHLNFTNWPAYIDRDFSVDGPGSRPSLFAFTQETAIDVTYRADINDNADFYATIRPGCRLLAHSPSSGSVSDRSTTKVCSGSHSSRTWSPALGCDPAAPRFCT